jgi:hypothetical protein
MLKLPSILFFVALQSLPVLCGISDCRYNNDIADDDWYEFIVV